MRARDLLLGLPYAFAFALLASPSPARACGGFFQETASADVVAVSDIRVLLVQQQAMVHQYVQVGYQGDTRRFAWVYPVAGNPQVTAMTTSPFPVLEQRTRPRVSIVTPQESSGGGGWGCGSDASDGAMSRGNEVEPPVKVWQSGQVGAFDYVVITATVAKDMLDWLQSNGFAVPQTTAPVLDHYLSLGWYFVAMKVSVQRVTAEVPATTVIRLSYAARELRYPLRMLSLSAAAETRFEMYVLSEGGVQPASPFAALTIKSEQVRATSPTTHNYDDVFLAMVRSRPRGLVWEYSARQSDPLDSGGELPQWQSYLLSRYRTVLTPADLGEDLRFVPAPETRRVLEFQLTYNEGQSAGLPAPLALLGLLFALRGVLRRRSRSVSSGTEERPGCFSAPEPPG